MMFKLLSTSVLVFSLALQARAHAIIAPPLGVSGTPTRNDVQRPSNNKQCGNINVAQTIGSSTPIVANADGSFTATVTNFNAGKDGSRQVTAQVDTTAAGKTFAAAQVTKNGDLAPTNVGSQQITVQLPANTKCTGGPGGNSCLVAFKTAGGFGNCVVVQQKAAGATAAPATVGAVDASANAQAVPAANNSSAGGHHHPNGQQQQAAATSGSADQRNSNRDVDVRAVGTRAARALRELE